jgi:hypothetical protein
MPEQDKPHETATEAYFRQHALTPLELAEIRLDTLATHTKFK